MEKIEALGYTFTAPNAKAKKEFAFLAKDKFKLVGVKKLKDLTLVYGEEDFPPHPKMPKEKRYQNVIWLFPDDEVMCEPEKWTLNGPFVK